MTRFELATPRPPDGRCNRQDKCTYHYTPKQYFADTNSSPGVTHWTPPPPKPPKPTSYIPHDIVQKSFGSNHLNNFVHRLVDLFGDKVTSDLMQRYGIGTSKHWEGATAFWPIDVNGMVRCGKIMLFDEVIGKRIKLPYDHITWVHSVLKLRDYQLKQCLFGEHLLSRDDRPIAIVESEKTAIIASVYLPKYVWMATGGKSNLSVEMMTVLAGRVVALFPDLGAFDAWKAKMEILAKQMPTTRFVIFDFLEQNATAEERAEGLDIADYLERFSLPSTPPVQAEPETLPDVHVRAEAILDEIKRVHGKIHLFPSLEDHSYVTDGLDF